MIKYLSVAVAAFLSTTPALADPVVPGVGILTARIDSVTKSEDDAHLVSLHARDKALDVVLGGCPKPVVGTTYYLIGIPTIGVFMTPKATLDAALVAAKNDFGKASSAVLEAHKMCVVVGARASRVV